MAIFCVLALIGTLAHQGYYLARDGRTYLTSSFGPALGVRIPAPINTYVQILCPAAAFAALATDNVAGGVAGLVLYTLWLCCQTVRLSNHLALTWMAVLSLIVAGEDPDIAMRWLLALMYLIAAAAKLNRQFLHAPDSAARFMLHRYCQRLTISTPPLLSTAAPALTVAVEAGIGALLLVPAATTAVFILAAVLHLALGLLGNFHFSITVLAPWSLIVSPRVDLTFTTVPFVALAAAAGAAVGAALTSPHVFATPRAGRGAAAAFGATFAAIVTYLVLTSQSEHRDLFGPAAVLPIALMAINVGLLWAGAKSEWAFIMFSNLRPGRPGRLLGVPIRWRATYFHVIAPTAAIAELPVPAHVRARIADRGMVLSGPMAAEVVRFAPGAIVRSAELDPVSGLYRPAASPGAIEPVRGPLLHPPAVPRDTRVPYLG